MKSSVRSEKLILLHLWKPQIETVLSEMVTENPEEGQNQDPRIDQAKRNQGLAQNLRRRRGHGHARGKGHMNVRGQETKGQGQKTRNLRKKRRVRGVDPGVGIVRGVVRMMEEGVEIKMREGGVGIRMIEERTKREAMLTSSGNSKI